MSWILGKLFGAASEQDDTVRKLDKLDPLHVAALHTSWILHTDIYQYTLDLLNSIEPRPKSAEIDFEQNDDQCGLLVRGKRRGWHGLLVSAASQPAVEHDNNWTPTEADDDFPLIDPRGRALWLYQEHDEDGIAHEPLCGELSASVTAFYYPSRSMWVFKITNVDQCLVFTEVFVQNISNDPDDFCALFFDTSDRFDSAVQRYRGQVMSVERSSEEEVTLSEFGL